MNKWNECDRCKRSTTTTIGSWFNTQMICEQCQILEHEHPLIEQAKKKEREACLNGDYNYSGIGLPKDLEEISRIAEDIGVPLRKRFEKPLTKEEEKDMVSFLSQYKNNR